MKLNEAIKMLDENEKLKFKSYYRAYSSIIESEKDSRPRPVGYSILSIDEGFYNILNYTPDGKLEGGNRQKFNGMIDNKREWELCEFCITYDEVLKRIIDKPVTVKFLCNYEDLDLKFNYHSFDAIMCNLSSILSEKRLCKALLHGKWYVKEVI